MKCIICNKDTEFIANGNSYCEKHLPKEIKNKRKIKDQFGKLIENEFR